MPSPEWAPLSQFPEHVVLARQGSNSGGLRVFASTSIMADESSMKCPSNVPFCSLDNGKMGNDADLPAGSISMSSFEPRL